jgi:alkanesulfonate monooxygenase SsuD/methylene tetrahydromethanopterin reductase-like flavin-dependent oxidoreductase (luciferase family)
VANLPLRLPSMIAKQAATLDVLSSGRFELGIGSGAWWDGIEAMGGPRRAPGESVDALEEAIRIIRLFWSGEDPVSFEGRYYSVKDLHPGPQPVHPISIWLGAYKPRMLRLVGRMADGWVPSIGYAPPADVPEMRARIDRAAEEAGRDPAGIRRLCNVGGSLDNPSEWVQNVREYVRLGFDTIVFWPQGDVVEQVERFAAEVVPHV